MICGGAAGIARRTRASLACEWVKHHSLVAADHGNAILMGANTNEHVSLYLGTLEHDFMPARPGQILSRIWKFARDHVLSDVCHGWTHTFKKAIVEGMPNALDELQDYLEDPARSVKARYQRREACGCGG